MPAVMVPGVVPTGTILFEWVDPSGNTHNFGPTSNVSVKDGPRGLGRAPSSLLDEKLPDSPGTIARYGSTGARETDLTLLLRAANAAALHDLIDDLYEWFDTGDESGLTPGYLRVTRIDGTQRQLACYYVGGFEGNLGQDVAGDVWQEMTVTLRAPEPYPTSTVIETRTYAPADFLNPLSVINVGEVDAYPVWDWLGPCSNITLQNVSTNQQLRLTASGGVVVLGGVHLTIDTRPVGAGRVDPSIQDTEGVNWYGAVEPNDKLWHLAPGQNLFVINATGASSATVITLQWYPRYRGFLR
jgi:hypothetical protein